MLRSFCLCILQLTSLFPLAAAFSVSTQQRPTMTTPSVGLAPQQQGIAFSHVQLYVDALEDLAVYKRFEDQLNEFFSKSNNSLSVMEKQELWQAISGTAPVDDSAFVSHNRDVVKQLLAGPGFRITAARYASSGTRSVLVTSKDPQGVQILVTAVDPNADETTHDNDLALFDKGTTRKRHLITFWATDHLTSLLVSLCP